MIPVLEKMLKDLDAAPTVLGRLEKRCTKVVLRNVMGAGEDSQEPAGPQDPEALHQEVPHPMVLLLLVV